MEYGRRTVETFTLADWPKIVRPAVGPIRLSVLVLHGYGANESDLVPITAEWPADWEVTFLRAPLEVFPGGYGWYDLLPEGDGFRLDMDGYRCAVELVAAWMGQSDASPSAVVGFSQGGGIALSLLESVPSLVGATGLCPVPPLTVDGSKPAVLLYGTFDTVVTPERLADTLASYAVRPNTEIRAFPVGHGINADMVEDIRRTLEGWVNS